MNETLFLIQIILVVSFAFGALKLGKGALTSWIVVQALLANLFVIKQIDLFGFNVTPSDAFAIGSLLGLNLIQEYFGRQEAQKSTFICFFFLCFFALASQLHLLYEPSIYDVTQSAFVTILSPAPRLLMASIAVFFIVQQIDIRLFNFLRVRFPRLSFVVRSGCTLVVSQFLDTILFSFAGLYGLVFSLVDVILVSFMIKIVIIFFATPALKWIKR